jgi:predicted DNA-binding transcriptional regulator AlpA
MHEDDERIDIRACCVMGGGTSSPLAPSTIYRLIKKMKWPKPHKVGGSSRWLLSEVKEALARMAHQ